MTIQIILAIKEEGIKLIMVYEALDIWNSPSLSHHGVKGMKWGVRKAYHNFQSRRYRRAAAKVQVDIDSFRGHENGIKTKNGKTVLSKREISDSIKGLEAVRNKNIAKAKRHEEWKQNDRKGLSKGQKIAIGVGIGAAVAVGAGVGIYMLKKHGAKPASFTTAQLKSMGIATFEPDRIPINKTALNTPVKNIMRGPSQVITGDNANKLALKFTNASRLHGNSMFDPRKSFKAKVAYNNLNSANMMKGNTSEYVNRLMTTKSGKAIKPKLLNKRMLDVYGNRMDISPKSWYTPWPQIKR